MVDHQLSYSNLLSRARLSTVGSEKTYFTTDECAVLARLSVDSQCQVLMIDIDHQTNILELFQTIPHLRVLYVRCKNNRNSNGEPTKSIDHFVRWLYDHLLFKFTYFIDQSSQCTHSISIYGFKKCHQL